MRKETIEVSIYEVGDIITINKSFFKLTSKQTSIGFATHALIIARKRLSGGIYSYKIISNTGKMYTFRPDEMGEEKYIGHIDLSQALDCV